MKLSIGQTVYLKTDGDQLPRLVTGMVIRPNDTLYILACGTHETTHYFIEISTEKDPKML